MLATETAPGHIIQLWNVATGQFTGSLPGNGVAPTLSRDGRVIAALGIDASPPIVWTRAHPDQPHQIGRDGAISVAVSPDGRTVAVATTTSARVYPVD